MAHYTKKQFKGREEEIKAFIRVFGQTRAASELGKTDPTLRKWLQETTGDPNYGLVPKVHYPVIPHGRDAVEWLFERFVVALLALRKRLAEQDKRIKQQAELLDRTQQSQQRSLASGYIQLFTILEELEREGVIPREDEY